MAGKVARGWQKRGNIVVVPLESRGVNPVLDLVNGALLVRATLHPVPPDLKRYHTLIIPHSIQQEGARVGCPNTNKCSLVATGVATNLKVGLQ